MLLAPPPGERFRFWNRACCLLEEGLLVEEVELLFSSALGLSATSVNSVSVSESTKACLGRRFCWIISLFIEFLWIIPAISSAMVSRPILDRSSASSESQKALEDVQCGLNSIFSGIISSRGTVLLAVKIATNLPKTTWAVPFCPYCS